MLVRRSGLVALGVVLLAAAPAAAAPSIRVLSSRADLVTGGDALVQIAGVDPATARVSAGGRDVSDAFAGRSTGLVRGLPLGRTVLSVRDGDHGARLTVRNHPLQGPLFAGPQTQPWLCAGPCAPPTTYRFVYRSTDPSK